MHTMMRMRIAVILLAMGGLMLGLGTQVHAQSDAPAGADTIKLLPPQKSLGRDAMETFAERKSAAPNAFGGKELSLRDLSNLLWVAYGVNRQDGKRTVPSSRNVQEADLYAFFQHGAYRYDGPKHALVRVTKDDVRKLVAGKQAEMASAPLMLVVVGHPLRMDFGDLDYRRNNCYIHGGSIVENIALFCSAAGLKHRPRGTMDRDQLRKVLGLADDAILVINSSVCY